MRRDGTFQLAFITIIIIVISTLGFLGLSWMHDNFGPGGALGMFFAIFIPVLLFIQQYLTGSQNHQTMQNINEYSAFDAKVDHYRQQSLLEASRGLRNVMTIEAKSQVDQTKLLEQRASSLAQVMSAAEAARMRNELFGGETEVGENDSLD